MLKANTKYTAREILEASGLSGEFGEIRINIGGIPISDGDHVIRIAEEGALTVIVGEDSTEIQIDESGEAGDISDAAREAKDNEGKENQSDDNVEQDALS